ncbi:MAG: hypothetical protein HQK53_11355 [Oligoflexia bacterium]|nr:hypothetical protein [Oligoflexia bacterium]
MKRLCIYLLACSVVGLTCTGPVMGELKKVARKAPAPQANTIKCDKFKIKIQKDSCLAAKAKAEAEAAAEEKQLALEAAAAKKKTQQLMPVAAGQKAQHQKKTKDWKDQKN